ncbi:hypothetical protein L9F63_021821, partial [Diploptera punctata]
IFSTAVRCCEEHGICEPFLAEKVLSLAMANGVFYWTNGDVVLTEEYHRGQDSYYQVVYPRLSDKAFISVSVNLPTSQPIPIPVNPPTNVQAILGAELAKTSWQMPHLLGGLGKGAWQNWSYELHIKDEMTGVTIFRRDINTTTYTIHNLKDNTEYVIKTAAYTSSGRGPWSSEFRGKTLKIPKDGKYPSILWSAAEGLLKSDVTGENVQTLIHNTNLKDLHSNFHITDIAWYRDKLYLVTNTTHVYWYNLTNHASGHLREMDSVGSIAVDWIGKKLYWSNPKQQLARLGNLNGTQQEPLPILTVAKELNIDAIQAYIYWSTGHAVECARLNGKNRRTYYPAELFSGKQVMGLTLNVDQRAVYWIVRSYEGSTLFQAPTAEQLQHGEEILPIKTTSLQHPHIQGPLCYFSDHLMWLQDGKNAVIGDLNGQNTAIISGTSLSGLNIVAVLDSLLHHYPNTSRRDEVSVIPEPIHLSSIHITGTWDEFVIKWDPVTNVNYDQVFYEVKTDFSKTDFSEPKVTVEPYLSYWNPGMIPYSELQITVKAFTYWGASPQVRTTLHSPPSVPTEPTNPRVFVSYSRNPLTQASATLDDVMAVFRWDPPRHSNGIVQGYKVKCSAGTYSHICDSPNLDATKLEYTAYNLSRNTTYYFQVQAYTRVGSGPLTDPIRADTDVEMPVPKLLLSTIDAVKITDCDKQENQTLSRSSGPPVDFAFISHENKFFWLSEMQELLSSTLGGRNRTKIVTLNSTGLSIAVDWVGRYIYWSEADDRIPGSTIYRLDLNQAEKGYIYASKVLNRKLKKIHSIDISPFKSTLFWIEVSRSGEGCLMTSRTDGSTVQPFFTKPQYWRPSTLRNTDGCTCPESPSVGKAMTIDQTDSSSLQVLWVDALENHVYLADANGCFCTVLVNATINAEAGLPPTSLTTDHHLLYWSNETEGKVYSIVKAAEDSMMASMSRGVRSVNITGVRRIAALGPHLQPYPDPKCLSPRQVPLAVSYVSHTDSSITLRLPNPERYLECTNMTLASIEYTVLYDLSDKGNVDCVNNMEQCSKLITYNQILEVQNLKPFSSYVFFVALKNYYSDLEGVSPVIGPPTTFQTAAGAPSSPQNVTVLVLNPTMVEVQWLPPQEFNDEGVWYEVHWCTEGMVAGVRQQTDKDVMNTDFLKDVHRAALKNLLPGKTYRIWVRANSQNSNTFSDSNGIVIETFPEPDNITLLHAMPYALNISWVSTENVPIIRHTIQYREAGSGIWNNLLQETEDSKTYFVDQLLPKTNYTFRLSLYYPQSTEPYIWPADERFTYESLGDCPTPPGMPIIQHLRRDVYQVTWDPSRENGAHIELYSLEGKIERGKRERREVNFTLNNHNSDKTDDDNIISDDSDGNRDDEWIVYYNGTDNYWIITDLSPSLKYVFRVRSMNKYGWSDFSMTSKSFDFTEAAMLAKQQELGIVLGISIPIVVVILCVTGMFALMYVFQRREKEKKALQVMTLTTVTRGPDVELATLRELPRRGNFVHNTNALYTTADIPTDEEIALLPHIRRDQITLTKFLGSGAFGEVFEGNARNLANSEGETRVAIKTLRKGATEQEKAEFLKEAQLMSNFKHEHILQLLGVCLDNDPNFIIMELMENGDLLSYLRSNRPLLLIALYTGNSLTLLDLLKMCVDVARGCKCLEDMHFVHRDLACRNCLVSSGDPQTRIVKIGDFGLARDIYKNDYYRKEGEGLLPVRWMAPESLVDGVFTCQSDVWAFGVLIWEIMTLGQQPYPAMTNLEVLHYVRNGGRLGQPNNCPEELYQLMLKCWNYNPEIRPTFKYCLEVLEELKSKSTDIPLIAFHNGHYVSRTRNATIL